MPRTMARSLRAADTAKCASGSGRPRDAWSTALRTCRQPNWLSAQHNQTGYNRAQARWPGQAVRALLHDVLCARAPRLPNGFVAPRVQPPARVNCTLAAGEGRQHLDDVPCMQRHGGGISRARWLITYEERADLEHCCNAGPLCVQQADLLQCFSKRVRHNEVLAATGSSSGCRPVANGYPRAFDGGDRLLDRPRARLPSHRGDRRL